jgi:hypothetical protein
METPAAVRARGITRAFGDVVALDGVGLVAAPGRIHGPVGPDRAGSTTLLGPAPGLAVADGGSPGGLGCAGRTGACRAQRCRRPRGRPGSLLLADDPAGPAHPRQRLGLSALLPRPRSVDSATGCPPPIRRPPAGSPPTRPGSLAGITTSFGDAVALDGADPYVTPRLVHMAGRTPWYGAHRTGSGVRRPCRTALHHSTEGILACK